MNSPVEVVETLNTIIRIQSDVIDELFRLLMQHISIEEAGMFPVLSKIDQATKLMREAKQ